LGRGGFGVISATANIPEAARIYEAMMRAASECDHKKMYALQEEANKYAGLVFPSGIKSPIGLHAMFNSPLNLPMVDLSRMLKSKNPNAIAAADAIHKAFESGMLQSLKKYLY
jgi:4-hydroxy-tetrahydrodipicolinate synthase